MDTRFVPSRSGGEGAPRPRDRELDFGAARVVLRDGDLNVRDRERDLERERLGAALGLRLLRL